MNEAWFANSPGLKIVCPSTPRDAKGLMKSALRDPNPVLVYEMKELYRQNKIAEELPVGDDALVPLGKASVRREGEDVTLVTYGNNVYHCLQAAENLEAEGFSAEVVDIRSLVPLDEATILASLKKTNRLVVVNEAPRTCGFAGEVLARLSEEAFEYLDAPPARVTRLDTPVPWVKPLESFVLPSADKVTEAALRVCRY
jgi:pyruvate/2-oxoglutarate/acetoin dehydrogenase E1 component